ncbi:MAG: hypothetical protein AB1757_17845 [Acidobacteriota bacterium]
MGSKLFKKIFSSITVLSFVWAMAATTTMAQVQETCTVNVPFQFSVGKRALPAGEYTIKTISDTSKFQKLLITSRDGKTSVIVPTLSTPSAKYRAKTQVNFNKYADRYFLSSISNFQNEVDLKFQKSKAEKSISQNAGATEIVTVASE